MLPRDLFITHLFEAAKIDHNIYFLSADLGAKALDLWRKELPEQFFHVGICEQNMIDVAAGLAQNGKKVFVYGMSCFVTLRCLEQIKVALSLQNLPVTILGIGVGLGYEDAGPTHYSLEDISTLSALPNLEILAPTDDVSTQHALKLCLQTPKLRYLRMERHNTPQLYGAHNFSQLGQDLANVSSGKSLCLVTTGHMHAVAQEIKAHYIERGLNLAIFDAFRLHPMNPIQLAKTLTPYDVVITLEEHFLRGGLGSCILETLNHTQTSKKVLRLGIDGVYFFENGGRKKIHELSQLDLPNLLKKIDHFLQNQL